MSESNGWIKFHRKTFDNPRVSSPGWLSVWLYLLLSATHKQTKFLFNGQVIELKPGQLVTGRYAIAKKTGVHPSKVQRILETMKIDHQIDQQAGNKSSLISILNWDRYQDIDQQAISKRSASDQQNPIIDHQIDQQKINKSDSLQTVSKTDNQIIDQQSEQQMVDCVTHEHHKSITFKKDKNYKKEEYKIISQHEADPAPQLTLSIDESTKKTSTKAQTDEEWLESLKTNRAYEGIDIDVQWGRAKVWCETHHKHLTRRRFVNWINRAEKPMQVNGHKPKTVIDPVTGEEYVPFFTPE